MSLQGRCLNNNKKEEKIRGGGRDKSTAGKRRDIEIPEVKGCGDQKKKVG